MAAYLHPDKLMLMAPSVIGSGNKKQFAVPADDLADYLNPIIERRERQQERFYGDVKSFNGMAVVGQIASEAAALTGQTDEASTRRLYDVRYRRCVTVSSEWAEAWLQAVDSSLEEAPVPTFPANRTGSEEMAEVWADDDLQRQRLKTALYRFTVGYCADFDQVCAEVEERRLDNHLADLYEDRDSLAPSLRHFLEGFFTDLDDAITAVRRAA